jgi:hypothetical protein
MIADSSTAHRPPGPYDKIASTAAACSPSNGRPTSAAIWVASAPCEPKRSGTHK